MASWSMTPANGSNFQTLEELRYHLKTSAENNNNEFPDDLIPEEDKLIPCKAKRTTTSSSKRRQTKEKNEKPKKDNNKTTTDEEKEMTNDDCDSAVCSPDAVVESPETDTEEEGTDFTDLKIVLELLIKDLKKFNARVSAISVVLEDIQASSISRQYSSLNKSIDVLKLMTTEGQSLVTRKKPRRTTKKKE